MMFEAEIERFHEVMTDLANSEFELVEGDPCNLDPDDEPLAMLSACAVAFEAAARDLQLALRTERRKRMDVLDNMQEDEYIAWEEALARSVE